MDMVDARPPRLDTGLPFEEQAVGSTWRTQRRTVTEHDLMTFVTTFGFTEALFLDADAARDLGFDGRLIPGALTLALAEGLVIGSGTLTGTGMAFLGGEMLVKKPVFVGDTIEVWVEVTAAHMTSRGDRGVVTTRNEVRNQHQEVVMVFTPKRMIKARGEG
jgi:acyl dehydratase